ncbi:MAG: glycosyltransferase family 4 protein [Carnobacterium sp.]
MKIIFAIRNDYQSHFGGDVVQMLKTKEYLEKIGNIEIVICNSVESIMENRDAEIMHIFNIQTLKESCMYMKAAKELNLKVALSTIYWDLSYSTYVQKTEKMKLEIPTKLGKNLTFSALKYLRKSKNDYSYLSKGYFENSIYLINNADILLPNSEEELEQISKNFNLRLDRLEDKTIVVPNAVDIDETSNSPYTGELPKNYVLEVARIEVIKNQINVVRALEDNPEIPIVFVGAEIESSYLTNLKKRALKRGNVYFLGRVPHEQLADIYRKAAVHILPSFRESPGLSSLEALQQKTNIVVSSKEYCPIDYYKFNEVGSICNPFDRRSIKESIMAEMNTKRDLNDDFLINYSYEKAAENTFLGYKKLLEMTN